MFNFSRFPIEINKRYYNDGGVQVAEFDILISDSSNSHTCKWLIECRDRPSQGSAPGSWIEQLIGRKMLHKLDRVIAVSTMGFSPGAIHWAREGGIELRTVTEAEQPENWLCKTVTFVNLLTDLTGFKMNLLNGLSDVERASLHNSNKMDVSFEKPGTCLPMEQIFQNLCLSNRSMVYANLAPGESKPVEIYYVPDDQTEGAIFAETSGLRIPLKSIEFYGIAKVQLHTVPFEQTKIYRENDEQNTIGQRVTCYLKTTEENTRLQVYDVVVEENRQISIELHTESTSGLESNDTVSLPIIGVFTPTSEVNSNET